MENAATPNSLERKSDPLVVLGIESTAHTLGVAVVSSQPPFILSDIRYKYKPKSGGILPREVAEFFSQHAGSAVEESLRASGIKPSRLDGIAVALGPGLGPALRVGASIARALASYLRKPLIGVNHAVAHLEIARALTGLVDPVFLYVSGGNTTVASFNDGFYRVFGETLDIALGNALDTFAREAGIAPPYIRGGDHIVDYCARSGRFIEGLPYVVKGQDVSYSGLLTAALRLLRRGASLSDVCYTFREIAYSSVVEVTERGLAHIGKDAVTATGGVAASRVLREKMSLMADSFGATFRSIQTKYAGDNGVMIALTGLLMLEVGEGIVEPEEAFIRQRWRLDRVPIRWFPRTLPLWRALS